MRPCRIGPGFPRQPPGAKSSCYTISPSARAPCHNTACPDLVIPQELQEPAPQGGLLCPPLSGDIPKAPAPQEGGRDSLRGVSSCSWDPGIYRPDKRVSCYSGLQFSDEKYIPPVSSKPGQGFKKPDCGAWVRKLRSGDKVRDIYHNCDNLSCPVCMPGTITAKARDDIEARFDLYEDAKQPGNAALIPGEQRNIYPRQIIFTLSPAKQSEYIARVKRTKPGEWTPDHDGLLLELVREDYNTVLRVSGLIGGVSVYHDARVKHPDTGAIGRTGKHLITMEAKVAGNIKDADPQWKIYDHIRKQKNPSRYYYLALHFHAIGFGKLIDAGEFETLMPGWRYHNKGSVKNVGGLARYLMSHMAMVDGHHAISWFGRMSSKSLGKEGLKTYDQEQTDPETGLPWIIIESTIPGEVGSIYRVKVTDYRGFFRQACKRRVKKPEAVIFPKGRWRKRSAAPAWIRERGIMAMSAYCDENGRL